MRSEIDMSARPTNLNIHPQSAIRIKPPSGRGKSFQLQFKDPDTNKWITYRSEAVFLINNRLKKGEISYEQAYDRMREERELLYKERDKHKAVAVYSEYNLNLLAVYLNDKYPERRRMRNQTDSYRSLVCRFNQALAYLPDTPLDTDIDVIQDKLDKATTLKYNTDGSVKIEKLADNKEKHKYMCEYLNRLLVYIGRTERLIPFKPEKKAPDYITPDQLDRILPLVKNQQYKVLFGLIFWTGMRISETLRLTEKDLINHKTLYITKQFPRDGEERLPKWGKKRRIHLDDQGQYWLQEWFKIPIYEREKLQGSGNPNKVLKKAGVVLKRQDDSFPDPKTLCLKNLRHSRAVYMGAAGLGLEMIAKSLGNNRDVCEAHYAGFVMTTDDEFVIEQKLAKAEETRQERNKTDQQDEIARLKAEIEKLKGA